jgi:alkylhydroperoxidase family enzyme
MAAYVSQVNRTRFCIVAHSTTAGMWYGDAAKVSATLDDLGSAPIDERLRATLDLLGKLTRNREVTSDDMRSALAAGVSAAQIEDALAVCLAFNITDRLADAFNFVVADQAAMDAGARHLLKRGYG